MRLSNGERADDPLMWREGGPGVEPGPLVQVDHSIRLL
jgi:hypothetical protein